MLLVLVVTSAATHTVVPAVVPNENTTNAVPYDTTAVPLASVIMV